MLSAIPDDPLPFAMKQLITGPEARDKTSILYSPVTQEHPTARHSLVTNMAGSDLAPFTGSGVSLTYVGGLPVVDQNYDGTADTFSHPALVR
ncbi:MAG: hypothetical protein R3C20_03140 [Planctomycetaceae bacterium]